MSHCDPYSFIDIKMALGELIMAGINAKPVISDNGSGKRCFLHNADNEVFIAHAFRDGASYVVKEQAVLDYIDDYKLGKEIDALLVIK